MIVKSVSHRSRAVDSHRALTVIFEESRCVVYHAMQPAHVLENCTIAVYNVKRGLRPRNVPTTIPFPDKRCGYHEQIMLIANPNGNALTVIIYQQVVRGQLRLGSLSISPNS